MTLCVTSNNQTCRYNSPLVLICLGFELIPTLALCFLNETALFFTACKKCRKDSLCCARVFSLCQSVYNNSIVYPSRYDHLRRQEESLDWQQF